LEVRILLITLILFSLFLENKKIIGFILFCIPFHFFLKSLLGLYFSNDIVFSFSLWKEIVIFILFLKVFLYRGFKIRIKDINYLQIIIFFMLFCISIMFFIVSNNKYDALISFKNLLLPFLLFFIILIQELNLSDIIYFTRKLVYSSLIVFIIGFIQFYLLREEFALFRGVIETISKHGEINYSVNAFSMMGLNRMYGPFTGPNEFGLFTAIILTLTSYLLYTYKSYDYKINYKLLLFTFIIGLIALVHTFSRVSFFFMICSTIIILLIEKKIKLFKPPSILFLLFSLSILILFIPTIMNVFIESVTFKELSANARIDFFFDGIIKIIKNPMGIGLGLVRYGSASQVFHTEIFWWLVALEISIIGFILYISFYIINVNKMIIKISSNSMNMFTVPAVSLLLTYVVCGFASVIILEPMITILIWSIASLGIRRYE
jgi:hypothetical protein